MEGQVEIGELVEELGTAIHAVLERSSKGYGWTMGQVVGVDQASVDFGGSRTVKRNGTATITVKINGGAKDSGS